MKGKTEELTFCAVAAALGTVLLIAASVLPTLRLALLCASGLCAVAANCRFGRGRGWAVFAVTAALALLVSPTKMPALFYALCGWYPLAKLRIERMESAVGRWAVKLALFAAFSAAAAALAEELTGNVISAPLWMLWAEAMAVCLVYDLAVKEAILLYLRKIAGRIVHG